MAQSLWISSRSLGTRTPILTSRLNALVQTRKAHYDAIVAGAGPAGLAVMGNLIESRPRDKFLWIDPDFQGGRFNREWREVPSNTKVKLFTDYGKATKPFLDVVEKTPTPNAMTALEELDPSQNCPIAYPADMCLMLTNGLCETQQVDAQAGQVRAADWDDITSTWTISSSSPNSNTVSTPHTTSNLILATGARPSTLALPLDGLRPGPIPIPLSLALQPSHLTSSLSESSNIAVIGGSHSAVLVLMNLHNLVKTTHPNLKVTWFTRSNLQYAEQRDGWILKDNTGLKGIAATFARENLEPSTLPPQTQPENSSSWIKKVSTSGGPRSESQLYEQHLPQCTHVITATGFDVNTVPIIRMNGRALNESKLDGIVYDNLNGGFLDAKGNNIKGLFGAGIAFPERVTDPEGNVSLNVGLWKFMKFLKRVVPQWVASSSSSDGGGAPAASAAPASLASASAQAAPTTA